MLFVLEALDLLWLAFVWLLYYHVLFYYSFQKTIIL